VTPDWTSAVYPNCFSPQSPLIALQMKDLVETVPLQIINMEIHNVTVGQMSSSPVHQSDLGQSAQEPWYALVIV
jgi:hypothetical protein